jgi:hypothetical protein
MRGLENGFKNTLHNKILDIRYEYDFFCWLPIIRVIKKNQYVLLTTKLQHAQLSPSIGPKI